jgi:aminoglycoside phosphotransferase (APT) family kinase protein
VRLIAGGRSNVTYLVSDDRGAQIVVRRPPFGSDATTAPHLQREWNFISALDNTAVRVPKALVLAAEGSPLGVPCYAMSYIEGLVVHDSDGAAALEVPARRVLAESLIDQMVALHRLDIDEIGLGDVARRHGYASRQIKRWKLQWEQTQLASAAAVDEAYVALADNLPTGERTAVVHGDFRLGNAVCSPAGETLGLLDWELATLGHPLADLGWLLSWWADDPSDEVFLYKDPPSLLAGFPSRSELTVRYRDRAGCDIDDLPFYVALSYWRGACIGAGVIDRYKSGSMPPDDSFDLDLMHQMVVARAEACIATVESGKGTGGEQQRQLRGCSPS